MEHTSESIYGNVFCFSQSIYVIEWEIYQITRSDFTMCIQS